MQDREHKFFAAGPVTAEVGNWTLSQVVIRIVALLLLFSLLDGLLPSLHGIEKMLVEIGMLVGAALVAKFLKKQHSAEHPYRSKDRPEIH